MALRPSWPGVSGSATTTDARRNLAGLLAKDTTGLARTGLLGAPPTIVSGRTNMNVDIAAFAGAAVQFGGPILLSNDAVAQLPSVLVSPASGTNYYVVYAKQNESTSPGTDPNNNALFSAVLSTTSHALARSSGTRLEGGATGMPVGALELATITIPSGKATTLDSGVVISQTFQYTAAEGGVVPVRNTTELAAWTPVDGDEAWQLDNGWKWRRVGGAWLCFESPWTDYTPTWAAANGAPAIGNGTLSFRWRYVGLKTIAIRGFLSFGSSTTGGAGDWSFTLPGGLATPAGGEQIFQTKYFTSSAQTFPGGGYIGGGSSILNPIAPISSAASNAVVSKNANSAGATGTGTPNVSGDYTFKSGSNFALFATLEVA